MAHAIALKRRIDTYSVARTIIVSACGVALIVAERFLPFA
tara:strand:+ start:487 stop:606 length:120 start_codon:yes stop_codon:yes gene_type:complete